MGSFDSAEECQRFLHRWVTNYVTPDADAPESARAKMPLREAELDVAPEPGKPGAYRCVLRLAPHYQLDEVAASLRLERYDTTLPANTDR